MTLLGTEFRPPQGEKATEKATEKIEAGSDEAPSQLRGHNRFGRVRNWRGLRNQLRNDVAMHVGQSTINPVMPERQPLVVDAQQVQDRGVNVVHLRWS